MRRGTRTRSKTLVLSLLAGLVMTGLGVVPAAAGSVAQRGAAVAPGGAVVSTHAESARKKKHKKKKHKKNKKKRKGASSRCWPGKGALGTVRTPGSVTYRWAGTACTSRYRVRVSPAWWGGWPGAAWYMPWVPGTARSTTYRVPIGPRAGDGMLAVAYANPVFAQLEANNAYNTRRVATSKSTWVAQWPWAPAPKPGNPVRFGSYNVMLNPTGTRSEAVSRNIGGHALTMVALQEADPDTAAEIVYRLNQRYAGSWAVSPAPGMSQQIIYRSDLFSRVDDGVYRLDNPKDSTTVTAPYAGFRYRYSDDSLGPVFHVTSVHYPGTPTSSWSQNMSTGAAAQVTADYLKRFSGPVIVAGDLRYGREPWGDRPGYVPAQPTFVRNGYYDAMASQSMHGQAYSTVNQRARQAPHASGSGPRADHILIRGIVGSRSFVNVANWTYGGLIPSDHNLIYSDLMIPTS